MSKKTIYTIMLVFFAAIFVGCAVWLGIYFYERSQSSDVYNNLASMMGPRPSATTQGTTQAPTQAPTQKPSIPLPSTGIPILGTTGTNVPSFPGSSGTVPGTIPTVPSIPSTPPVPTIPIPTPPVTTAPIPTEPTILPELKDIYELNNHLVGRVIIDGTSIDYPVLQTPNTPEWRNYYLYRDFYGKDNRAGCIYVQENCNVFAPTDNVILYGHNMTMLPSTKGSWMFGELTKYKSEGKKFYEAHKYIYFDTLYERHTYEIVSVFVIDADATPDDKHYFPFHAFVNAFDEAEFDQYVQKCKDLSFYDIELTPKYGDKLLCLTTCNYKPYANGRLVVMAVRID